MRLGTTLDAATTACVGALCWAATGRSVTHTHTNKSTPQSSVLFMGSPQLEIVERVCRAGSAGRAPHARRVQYGEDYAVGGGPCQDGLNGLRGWLATNRAKTHWPGCWRFRLDYARY